MEILSGNGGESPIARVVRNPDVLGGEPTIEGTRVSVREVVLSFQLHTGIIPEVYRGLPTLPPGGVEIALSYFAQHLRQIERHIDLNNGD